jgi:hypothetical protein
MRSLIPSWLAWNTGSDQTQTFDRSPAPQPFQFRNDHYTSNPRLPYTLFGYGTFKATENTAIHYFRLRPYLGSRDPVLFRGAPSRERIARTVLASERREVDREIWSSLLLQPPTHVLRIGWISLRTRQSYDILYIPINFLWIGYSAEGVAKDCGKYLIALLERGDPKTLCPGKKGAWQTDLFWLANVFWRFRWQIYDRPLQEWKG